MSKLRFDDKVGFYPCDWNLTRVNLLGDLYGGSTPDTTKAENWGGEIVWLVPSDLTALGSGEIYIYDSETKLTETGFRSCSTYMLPEQTLCLSSRATLGEAAISGVKLCTNQGFINVVADKSLCDVVYLLYWVKFQKNYISRFAAGTTFLEIGKRTFGKLKIALPRDVAEQKAIAGIIAKVDEAIEAVENSIKAAERLKRSLMQNLLSGKLKPDGTWRKPDEFHTDEKLGRIPKGWSAKRLSEVFDINVRTLPSKTDPEFKFRYITIESVNTEKIDFHNCSEYSFKEAPGRARRIIGSSDILISGVRPNLKAFAIYEQPSNENWICSTGFFVLSAKSNEDNKFHFFQLLSSIGEAQFHSYVAGTNYPAINNRDIRSLHLFHPGYEEQCQISEILESTTNISRKKELKILSLVNLKKSLMQNLLTGKVQVDVEKINKLLAKDTEAAS